MYYSSTVGDPIVYWKIDLNNLKTFFGCHNLGIDRVVSSVLGTNGKFDNCHIEITKISKDVSENFAKAYCYPPNVFICLNDKSICIPKEKMKDLFLWIETIR